MPSKNQPLAFVGTAGEQLFKLSQSPPSSNTLFPRADGPHPHLCGTCFIILQETHLEVLMTILAMLTIPASLSFDYYGAWPQSPLQ